MFRWRILSTAFADRFQCCTLSLGLTVAFFPLAPLFGEPPAVLLYKGFSVDASQIQESPGSKETEAEIREQIDIISSVGVSKEILTFFHSVPIKLIQPIGLQSENLAAEIGFYSVIDKDVQFSTNVVAVGHKPILIHELLHAFQVQCMEGGINNPTIIKFYNQAKNLGAYAPQSHMMLNNMEFFACSGTTYLFGVSAQEPFYRNKIQTSQPEFFQYLKSLFGPRTGTYSGSLTQ